MAQNPLWAADGRAYDTQVAEHLGVDTQAEADGWSDLEFEFELVRAKLGLEQVKRERYRPDLRPDEVQDVHQVMKRAEQRVRFLRRYGRESGRFRRATGPGDATAEAEAAVATAHTSGDWQED